MKTATHEFNTIHGHFSVRVDIFAMDHVEAEAYEQPDARYRIEGFINGTPAGTVFSTGNLGSCYWGDTTEDAARFILALHLETYPMQTKHEQFSFLAGKKGRIYTARKGSVMAFVLDSGETYLVNCPSKSGTLSKCVAPAYWQNSIDWAGSFSDYFMAQMAYDCEDKPHYPRAEALVEMTSVQINSTQKFANA